MNDTFHKFVIWSRKNSLLETILQSSASIWKTNFSNDMFYQLLHLI